MYRKKIIWGSIATAIVVAVAVAAWVIVAKAQGTRVGDVIRPGNTVIVSPNGFANILRVCQGHEGIYELHGQSGVYVVPNDPHCP